MSTDHDIPVTKETHEHIPTRFQFGLLSMFVVTTAVAVACSMTFSMSDAVAIPLFVLFSVILTGVLITVIVYGRSYQRTFCIGAVVPFGFLLFMLAFFGVIIFFDGSPPRSDLSAHPGEFATTIKKPVGKLIGYCPIIYELGLQLVMIGRGVLNRAVGLDRFLDTVNTQTVILQSIHLVDVAARELLRDVPRDTEVESEIPLPGWAKGIEWIGRIKAPWSSGFQRGKGRLRYSVETGRAAISVRTWGQTRTGPYTDAIEDGIDQFIHQEDEPS